MKYNHTNRMTRLALATFGAVGLSISAKAADIDVIATQTSFNPVYGLDMLSGDTTWESSDTIILKDRLYVPDGVTLTIQPGTKIYSSTNNSGTPEDPSDDLVGAVIVCRGGQIQANGTAAAPIVFDAIQTLEVERGLDTVFDPDNLIGPKPSPSSAGLWGGIVMLGNAYCAVTDSNGDNIGNKIIEGFVPTGFVDGDGDSRPDVLEYGFDLTTNTHPGGVTYSRDDADDSGDFTYVSIRHGGYEFGTDNEINGLTLGGVGTGTTIHHVEVVGNLDDGIEFFGGTVNTSYLIAAFCQDDSFDIDEGHGGPTGGIHQFWVAIQNPNGGDNFGEWDGVGGDDKASTKAGVIRSAPKIYNATLIGPGADTLGVGDVDDDNGLYMDDFFSGALINSIIADGSNYLASFSSDGDDGDPDFRNNIVGDFGRYNGSDEETVLQNAPTNYYVTPDSFGFSTTDDNTVPDTDPNFAALTRSAEGFLKQIDPRPTVLDTNVEAPMAPAVTANYRGAFDSTTNWAAGWTFLDENDFFDSKVDPVIVDVVDSQLAFNSDYGLDMLDGDTTWFSTAVYVLTDRVYVPDGVTLTIEPGTKIYSTTDEQGTPEDPSDDTVGAVIVCRGGTIEAAGTMGAPILFDALETLEAECGIDLPFDDDSDIGPKPSPTSFGLWGGIVVLSNAYCAVTASDGTNIGNKIIEGFVPTGFVDGDGDSRPDVLEYGRDLTTNTVGTTFPTFDNAADSGTLTYISIRHGGYEFGTDNEINGLTLAGVGTGTVVENIEIVANLDDGIEFFGGTVNTCNIAVAFCGDDSFDIDEGHGGPTGGNHQFWFTIQNPNTGDNLGEWDGVGGDDKDSTDAGVIRSNPKIWNATLIGPGATTFTNSDVAKDNGLFMDDFFNGEVYSSIITGSVNFLTSFAGDGDGSSIVFADNTVGEFGRFDGSNADSVLNGAPVGYYVSGFSGAPTDGNTAPGTDPNFVGLARSFNGFLLGIDPNTSPLDTAQGNTPTPPKTAAYRGAFGGTNWLSGWSFLDENGYFSASFVDSDGDNLTDDDEELLGTNPSDPDTDGDGIRDDIEAFNLALGFDPLVPDANQVLTNVATTEQLLDIGYFAATIDTGSGTAVLELDLEEDGDLADPRSVNQSIDVGLPSGTRFYRFTDGN